MRDQSKLFGTIFAAVLMAGVFSVQAAEPKTAEESFKNIIQLKGTPADQLIPAMTFISASLGVECSFCHVEGKMELDEKKTKNTAREMMAMTAAINKNSFGGKREVTCYSCHHGSAHPAGTPAVMDSDRPTHAEQRPAAGERPNAGEVLEKYVAALGGADAIKKLTSRVEKGLIVTGGNDSPIELYLKAPNKRISVTHFGKGESFTAFDGSIGWLGSTGRPAREMSAAEAEAAGIDAEFYLPLRLAQIFEQLGPGRPDTVNGVECDTLIGTRPGKPPVRFYFEKHSGLLLRQVRYGETPLGRNPTQIDYADYRAVDGVKVPFRWTLSRTNGRFTIQITEVKNNVPLEDERFRKPAGEVK